MKPNIDKRYIPLLSTLVVFVVLYTISGVMFRGFFSLRVFVNFFIDNSFLGIAAVGMTFVILTGGIDLSVGAVIAFSGILMGTLVEHAHIHPVIAIAITLLIGAGLGTAHGLIIHFFDAPPFIVTLGGMFLARGLAQMISLEAIPIYNPFFSWFMSKGISLPGGIVFPWVSVLFIGVFLIGLWISHMTAFGRNVYAIGGNTQSAVLMGLPVGLTRVLTYTLSGVCFALAGVVYTMYTSAGYCLSGVLFEMDVIAAVVIGGTLITGGSGYLAGTLLGVLILGIIQSFIVFQGTLSSWWARIAIGFLLFLFILFQRISLRMTDKKIT